MAHYSQSQLEVLRTLLNGRSVEAKVFYQGFYRGKVIWVLDNYRYASLVLRTYYPKSIARPISRRSVSIDAFLREFGRRVKGYHVSCSFDDIPF